MGEIAEMMLDGILDEQTGEYIGPGVGYPRTKVKGQYNTIPFIKDTPAEAKIRSIRKEIAILVKSGIPIEQARKEMNLKYGKGWREKGLVSNSTNQWSEKELKPFK